METLLIIWTCIAIWTGYAAQNKGRSFVPFFLMGFFLPFISWIGVAFMAPSQYAIERKALAHGARTCPFCAELIQYGAIVCKHCGRDLPAS